MESHNSQVTKFDSKSLSPKGKIDSIEELIKSEKFTVALYWIDTYLNDKSLDSIRITLVLQKAHIFSIHYNDNTKAISFLDNEIFTCKDKPSLAKLVHYQMVLWNNKQKYQETIKCLEKHNELLKISSIPIKAKLFIEILNDYCNQETTHKDMFDLFKNWFFESITKKEFSKIENAGFLLLMGIRSASIHQDMEFLHNLANSESKFKISDSIRSKIYAKRAQAYKTAEKYEEGIKELNKALSLQVNDKFRLELLLVLADMQRLAGNLKEAFDSANTVLNSKNKLVTDDIKVNAIFTIALVKYAQNNLLEALNFLNSKIKPFKMSFPLVAKYRYLRELFAAPRVQKRKFDDSLSGSIITID